MSLRSHPTATARRRQPRHPPGCSRHPVSTPGVHPTPWGRVRGFTKIALPPPAFHAAGVDGRRHRRPQASNIPGAEKRAHRKTCASKNMGIKKQSLAASPGCESKFRVCRPPSGNAPPVAKRLQAPSGNARNFKNRGKALFFDNFNLLHDI